MIDKLIDYILELFGYKPKPKRECNIQETYNIPQDEVIKELNIKGSVISIEYKSKNLIIKVQR